MRTAGAVYADTPHGGGYIFYNATDLYPSGTAPAFTRTAGPPIVPNWVVPNTGTTFFNLGLQLPKRLLEFPARYPKQDAAGVSLLPHQERFGNAAGGPGWVEGAPGFPPYLGAAQLVTALSDPPKGVQLLDVVLHFSILGGDLTTHTIAVYRNRYANGVAIAADTLLAATTLTFVVAVNPYVVAVPIVAAPFEIVDASDVIVDIAVVTPGGGTYVLYGVGVHFNFNFN